MKRIFPVLTALILGGYVQRVVAQPIVNFPTNSQVLTVGDTITISWVPRSNAWNTIFIGLQYLGDQTMKWIGPSVPNSGSYTWNVTKWTPGTGLFTVNLYDGGDITNTTKVLVVIRDPTPSTATPVPIEIKKVVSIEWKANTSHKYRVEASDNLTNWVTLSETPPLSTNAVALFYQDQVMRFFRVFDLTP